MKKTEQRWLHKCSRRVLDKDEQFGASENYLPCTVTYSEPEWEDMEVVRWLTSDGKTFLLESIALDHQAKLTEGQIVKLRGTYRRRKPEPEPEVWEGVIEHSHGSGNTWVTLLGNQPWRFEGERVEVRVIG